MPNISFFDLVSMSTSTIGNGTITLGTATTGARSFANAGVANATSVEYKVLDANGINWEVGIGTYYSNGTLTRNLRESSTGSLLNLSGNATVEITFTANTMNEVFASPYALGTINPNSAAFTTVTAATPLTNDNSTNVATTIWVRNQAYLTNVTSVANATFANSANNANFSTLSAYANSAGSANVAITQPLTDNTTNIATTAFVHNTAANYLPLTGGSLSGNLTVNAALAASAASIFGSTTVYGAMAAYTVTATTQMTSVTTANSDSSTNVATTAFVQHVISNAIANVSNSITINLSGDAIGTGSGNNVNLAVTLATVNSNVGVFGNSIDVPVITVNAKGLVTAIHNTAISFPAFPTSVANATFANFANVSNYSISANVAVTQPITDNTTNIATTAFVQEHVSNAGGSYLPITGGDLTGPLQIEANNTYTSPLSGGSPPYASINLNGPTSSISATPSLNLLTNNTVMWAFGIYSSSPLDSTQTGSDLVLGNFDDSGNLLAPVIQIERSTGAATFFVPPVFAQGLISAGQIQTQSLVIEKSGVYQPAAPIYFANTADSNGAQTYYWTTGSFGNNNDFVIMSGGYLELGTQQNVVVIYASNNLTTFQNTIVTVTQPTSDNSTNVATTAYVQNQNYISNTGTLSAPYLIAGSLQLPGFGSGSGAISFQTNGTYPVTNLTGQMNIIGSLASDGTSMLQVNQFFGPTALTIHGNNGVVQFGNTITTVTQPTGDNSTNVATTAWVKAQGYGTGGSSNSVTITLTGDVSGTGSGNNISFATTLANVNSNAGTYGNAIDVPVITVNNKGLVTAISNIAISFPSAPTSVANSTFANTANNANYATTAGSANVAITQPITDNTTNIATTAFVQGEFATATAGTFGAVVINNKGLVTSGLNTTYTGDVSGTGSANTVALTLANVNSNVGTYSLATVTVNAKGLVTAVSSGSAGSSSTFATTVVMNANATITNALTMTSNVVNSTTEIIFQNAGVNRWQIQMGGQETGNATNTGANLYLTSFMDNGNSTLANVITIYRSNGLVAFSNAITMVTQPAGNNTTNGATTAFVTGNFLPFSGGTMNSGATVTFPNINVGLVLTGGQSPSVQIGAQNSSGSSAKLTLISYGQGTTTGPYTNIDLSSATYQSWGQIPPQNGYRQIRAFYYGIGTQRWGITLGEGSGVLNNSAVNINENFFINAYNDGGTYTSSPVTIFRSNAIAQFANTVIANGMTITGANSSTVRTINYAVIQPANITGGTYTTGVLNVVNTVSRFVVGLSNTAEVALTNTNVGSNYIIQSYSDNAATVVNTVTIYRSNGLVAVANTITTVTQPTGDNSTNVATTAFVATATSSLTYANLPSELSNVPLAIGLSGQPTANAAIGISIAQSTNLPSNFTGAQGYCQTLPTANAIFVIAYNRSGTITTIGNATFTTASHTPTFSTASSVSLLAGDWLYMTAPATQDATLSTLSITLLGARV